MSRHKRINLPATFEFLAVSAVIVLFSWFLSLGLQPGIYILLLNMLFIWSLALVALFYQKRHLKTAIRNRRKRMSKWISHNQM